MQPSSQSDFRIFSSPEKEISCPFSHFPFPPPVLGNRWSIFCLYRFAFLDIQYNWNPVICVLLCLTSLNKMFLKFIHIVRIIHVEMYQYFDSFYWWMIFHCSIFLIQSPLMDICVISTFWLLWPMALVVFISNSHVKSSTLPFIKTIFEKQDFWKLAG